LPASSLDWLRVLRPAGFAVALAGRAFPPASILRPAASGFDRLVEARGRNPLAAPEDNGGYLESDATNAELIDLIPSLSASYALHPDWHSPELSLLLAHAASKESYGDLHRGVVVAPGRGPVGCYLYRCWHSRKPSARRSIVSFGMRHRKAAWRYAGAPMRPCSTR
jgi:hypothetical protein